MEGLFKGHERCLGRTDVGSILEFSLRILLGQNGKEQEGIMMLFLGLLGDDRLPGVGFVRVRYSYLYDRTWEKGREKGRE